MTSDLLEVVAPQTLPPLAVGMRDAARLIGLSPRRLQQLALAGEIPSVKIDGRRLFRLATLDRWLAERETSATGVAP